MITLKTLSQATAQEVFDQVAKHLLIQNRKCALNNGSCIYRSNDGLKCAAGNLIADDEYDPNFEQNDWETLVIEDKVPDTHYELILGLQQIHDVNSPKNWRKQLRLYAKAINLKFNEEQYV